MAVNILTQEDLQQFKSELFAELQKVLSSHLPNHQAKFLKSYQIRDMLSISRGTLQTMRTNGTLVPTQVGGLMFYNYEDIVKLMMGNKSGKK